MKTRNHHFTLDHRRGGRCSAWLRPGPGAAGNRAAELQKWPVHDEARPMPPVVDPGPAGPPAPVPADAAVLFDGKDLSGWTTAKGAPAKWIVRDGFMEAVKGAGSIQTTRAFGDCQLHVEWASPAPPVGRRARTAATAACS
ncbi:MAG: DUF1080 domain-containing protein [Comamonadaceae bacterium]|nr:DUF1080 domain-containing protein [Comamonadaceae bacterium]